MFALRVSVMDFYVTFIGLSCNVKTKLIQKVEIDKLLEK